jgi:hypothetical protein
LASSLARALRAATAPGDSAPSLRQINVAQEPDQPVEQQILHGGIEIELGLA